MNYSEARNRYIKHRENMVLAERDKMHGSLMQTVPNPPKPPNVKITPKITTKRERILFVRDYMKEYGRITAKGLSRKHEGIFKNTRKKPDKQLIKDFTVILTDLVNMGILRKYSRSRGSVCYVKVINPDKLEGLRNG